MFWPFWVILSCSMKIYVWIYENGVKELAFRSSVFCKLDDIKIKRNVSLFSLSLLSYLPFRALLYFFFVSLDFKAFGSREMNVYMGHWVTEN